MDLSEEHHLVRHLFLLSDQQGAQCYYNRSGDV